MDRRRAAGALLALAACIACSAAAPTASNHTTLDLYEAPSEGCYYNFQHYGEGDRIMTNEPCLNCTCHNKMLMCYLKVCPFTKPIGQDCTIEKRADQCCPIVTCPDVPVDLLTSTSTSSPAEYGGTGVGKYDKYGCSINGKYFPEGSKVPPTPNKPCEHCYCIRNMTTCVMQECTLHVDGCTPIYHKEVCCPVRYSCDHPEDEIPLLDDMTTTVRPTPGFLLTTTTISPVTQVSQDCVHDDQIFSDGALIKTEKACEHCYCMKGDIVCVVQECGTPMENEGKNCTSLPPREGQCCPDTYICEGDEVPLEISTQYTMQPIPEEATTLPPRRTSAEGSGYRNEPDEPSYTETPLLEPELEGSGEEESPIKPIDTDETIEPAKQTPSIFDEEILHVSTTIKTSALEDFEKITTKTELELNTVPSGILKEESSEPSLFEGTTAPTEKAESTERITSDEDKQTHEDEIITTISDYHLSSLPHSSRKDEYIITTEPSFKKEDEDKLSLETSTEIEQETVTVATEETGSTPFHAQFTSTHEEYEPKSTTSQLPEYTEELKATVPSKEATTETLLELSTSIEISKPEKELGTTIASEVHVETGPTTIIPEKVRPETTTINPIENEIDEGSSPDVTSGRIPGEGDCLLNSITYRNDTAVPSSHKCHSSCKCISSIIKCDPIICSPPPEYMDNCQPIYDSPASCCPTYVCDQSGETMPPQPHSQMSGTESPVSTPTLECIGDECQLKEKEPTKIPSEICSSVDCLSEIGKRPEIGECGPQGCDDISQIPTHLVPTPQEECLDDKCIPSTQSCVGSDCQVPPVKDLICDKEHGCEISQDKPCEGVNCKIEHPPQDYPSSCKDEEECKQVKIPESSKPLCEGDSCQDHKPNCDADTCGPSAVTPPTEGEICAKEGCEKPIEGPVEKPVAEPVEKPEEPIVKPVEGPVEGPLEGPVKGPVEGHTERPVEEHTEELTEKPIEGPVKGLVEGTTEGLVGGPAEEPIEGPAEKPGEIPFVRPAEEPTDGPIKEPVEGTTEGVVEGSAEGPTEGPVEGPTEEAVGGPAKEHTEIPVKESVEGFTENPVERPVEGSSKKPVERPVEGLTERPVEGSIEGTSEEPVKGPADGSVEGPTEESVKESVEKPVERPIEGLVEEPVEGPVNKPIEKPSEGHIGEECAEESCRRKQVPEIGDTIPSKCTGYDCISQEPAVPAQETSDVEHLSTKIPVFDKTTSESGTEKLPEQPITEDIVWSSTLPTPSVTIEQLEHKLPETYGTEPEETLSTKLPESFITEEYETHTETHQHHYTESDQIVTEKQDVFSKSPETVINEIEEISTKSPEQYVTVLHVYPTKEVEYTTKQPEGEYFVTELLKTSEVTKGTETLEIRVTKYDEITERTTKVAVTEKEEQYTKIQEPSVTKTTDKPFYTEEIEGTTTGEIQETYTKLPEISLTETLITKVPEISKSPTTELQEDAMKTTEQPEIHSEYPSVSVSQKESTEKIQTTKSPEISASVPTEEQDSITKVPPEYVHEHDEKETSKYPKITTVAQEQAATEKTADVESETKKPVIKDTSTSIPEEITTISIQKDTPSEHEIMETKSPEILTSPESEIVTKLPEIITTLQEPKITTIFDTKLPEIGGITTEIPKIPIMETQEIGTEPEAEYTKTPELTVTITYEKGTTVSETEIVTGLPDIQETSPQEPFTNAPEEGTYEKVTEPQQPSTAEQEIKYPIKDIPELQEVITKIPDALNQEEGESTESPELHQPAVSHTSATEEVVTEISETSTLLPKLPHEIRTETPVVTITEPQKVISTEEEIQTKSPLFDTKKTDTTMPQIIVPEHEKQQTELPEPATELYEKSTKAPGYIRDDEKRTDTTEYSVTELQKVTTEKQQVTDQDMGTKIPDQIYTDIEEHRTELPISTITETDKSQKEPEISVTERNTESTETMVHIYEIAEHEKATEKLEPSVTEQQEVSTAEPTLLVSAPVGSTITELHEIGTVTPSDIEGGEHFDTEQQETGTKQPTKTTLPEYHTTAQHELTSIVAEEKETEKVTEAGELISTEKYEVSSKDTTKVGQEIPTGIPEHVTIESEQLATLVTKPPVTESPKYDTEISSVSTGGQGVITEKPKPEYVTELQKSSTKIPEEDITRIHEETSAIMDQETTEIPEILVTEKQFSTEIPETFFTEQKGLLTTALPESHLSTTRDRTTKLPESINEELHTELPVVIVTETQESITEKQKPLVTKPQSESLEPNVTEPQKLYTESPELAVTGQQDTKKPEIIVTESHGLASDSSEPSYPAREEASTKSSELFATEPSVILTEPSEFIHPEYETVTKTPVFVTETLGLTTQPSESSSPKHDIEIKTPESFVTEIPTLVTKSHDEHESETKIPEIFVTKSHDAVTESTETSYTGYDKETKAPESYVTKPSLTTESLTSYPEHEIETKIPEILATKPQGLFTETSEPLYPEHETETITTDKSFIPELTTKSSETYLKEDVETKAPQTSYPEHDKKTKVPESLVTGPHRVVTEKPLYTEHETGTKVSETLVTEPHVLTSESPVSQQEIETNTPEIPYIVSEEPGTKTEKPSVTVTTTKISDISIPVEEGHITAHVVHDTQTTIQPLQTEQVTSVTEKLKPQEVATTQAEITTETHVVLSTKFPEERVTILEDTEIIHEVSTDLPVPDVTKIEEPGIKTQETTAREPQEVVTTKVPEITVPEEHEIVTHAPEAHTLSQETTTEILVPVHEEHKEITKLPEKQTSGPKYEYPETTPYLVELEEHTHKIVEEISTTIPTEEIFTTVYSEAHKPEYDLQTQQELESSTEKRTEEEKPETSTKEAERPLEDQETVSTPSKEFYSPEIYQTPPTVSAQEPEKASESSVISEEYTQAPTTLAESYTERESTHSTKSPVEEHKESTTYSVTQPTEEKDLFTPSISLATEKPHVPEHEITSQTEKGILQSTTITFEEEFVPVTTKGTTTKIKEEAATTPSTLFDKFTKPEEKPSEVLAPAGKPEIPKPGFNDIHPTDEIPPPEEESHFPPSGTGGYGQEPDYVEEDQAFGPGTCRYGGKVYVSAQQIPRDDPCDFCFCFRSDIICLQQSCPPPIHGCHEEPIQGFCCPRYECPVSMATTLNVTTTTTTTTTTLPPHFLPHAYKGAAQRRGCQIKGHTYKVGEVVRASSGPCLHCTCGGDGQMKCDPKVCTPEPMLRQMIAAAVSAKRRR